MKEFDLAIIGGGPAGYVAAVRASQLKMSVAIIEKRATLGGTCLNVGCIPSKALLDSSEHYENAHKRFAEHGIQAAEIKMDVAQMMKRKDKIVAEVCAGVDFLMKKNKVERFLGVGSLVSASEVQVLDPAGGSTALTDRKVIETIKAKKIIIATGSVPIELPTVPVDGKAIITSDHAIALTKVPKHMVVIGAGVIGLELGSVWRRLGSKVTVVEALPRLFGTADRQGSNLAQRILEQQGIEFLFEHKVEKAEAKKGASTALGNHAVVTVKAPTGESKAIEADVVLCAIGRKPYLEGLGLDKVGVKLTERGRIDVNFHNWQTSVPGVYAIGDCINGPMLAHKAMEEGVAVVEVMAGQAGHVNYDVIPGVVYTHPEVAWVGLGEEELKEKGIEYNVGRSFFKPNGRAKAMMEGDGQLKILADKKTDRILGAFCVGAQASQLIAELTLAMEFGASSEDVARTCHAHPTLSEIVKDAAESAGGWAIHQ
ncbi:MAG TPA: dihydrolipoyl dehydrogenase [Turneriella sp.]|nr:dihydrolipoyl dehydrogenase [Turneriella sp.]